MKLWTIFAILLLTTALLTGCWWEKKPSYLVENITTASAQDTEQAPAPRTTTGSNREDTKTTGRVITSSKSKSGSGSGSSSSDSITPQDPIIQELENLLSNKNMEFKAEYNLKTTMDGQSTTSQITERSKGEQKIRSDLRIGDSETRTYYVNNILTTCNNNGGWTCEMYDTSNEVQAQPAVQLDEFNVQKDSSMEVAGTSTTCYTVQSRAEASQVKYCFSPEGIPLYVNSITPGFQSEMTATSYSTTVDDSDFELPEGAQVNRNSQ